MGKASRTKQEERTRRSHQASEASHHLTGRAQTRREKRREQEREITGLPDYRASYDFRIPGGLMRDPTPVRLAGQVVGNFEAEMLRNVIIKALESFGFLRDPRAAAGVLAEAINAFPKSIRGNLAIGLIKGTGLLITTDNIEVCADCGGEKAMTIHPDPESVEGYDATDEEAALPMMDTTVHAPECHFHRITDTEGRPANPVEYRSEDVIMILQPPHYEPLDTDQSPRSLPIDDPEKEYTFEDTVGNPIPEANETDAGATEAT